MSWNQLLPVLRRGLYSVVLCLLVVCTYGCTLPDLSERSLPSFDLDIPLIGDHELAEVSPPALLEILKQKLPNSAPQVEILEPADNSTLDKQDVEIKLSVSDFKLFKDSELELGPHILLVLDEQPPLEIYDLSQPIRFPNLSPGTHTLRAIAEYPWHESFKNPAAYAQRSFTVLTSSTAHDAGDSPILTTSALESVYTAEPVLIDFVVRQAGNQTPSTATVKVTINDQSFTIHEPNVSLFLTGLKTGQNWLKLELQDKKGRLSTAPFSEQLFSFDFRPDQSNSLGQLLSETLTAESAAGIVGLPKPTPKVIPSSPSTPMIPPAAETPKSPITDPIKKTETTPSTSSIPAKPPVAAPSSTGSNSPKPAKVPSVPGKTPSSGTAAPTVKPDSLSKPIPPSPGSEPLKSKSSSTAVKRSPASPSTTNPSPSSQSDGKTASQSKPVNQAPSASPAPHSPTATAKQSQTAQTHQPLPPQSIPAQPNALESMAPKMDQQNRTSKQDDIEPRAQTFREKSQENMTQGLKNWRDRFRQIKEQAKSTSPITSTVSPSPPEKAQESSGEKSSENPSDVSGRNEAVLTPET